ncbi:MAG: HupE/UreJ family protein [Gammaproteobacteria bacterium]|nr:HupE/UreJ family protein [Gammaproteobacteria bacterium]MCP4090634.1 HupE/UreJ family protein [Gammaproteobacteria bacterium]MCP4275965.1 HupE/UreJ family protein [Gammaproteobacteria bacterium]MCP4832181.1 HupE/UreJ family protein [Gammaproteobacteria bacterium]MCP4928182.1 HupE/UreJ family protein [Gammaproteobacteria bacterium]
MVITNNTDTSLEGEQTGKVTREKTGQREVQLQIRTNLEVILANISPDYTDTSDAPNAELYDRLRALPANDLLIKFDSFAPTFTSKLRLEADGQPVELRYIGVDIPKGIDPELVRDSYIYLQGKLPENVVALTWQWPDDYGSNVLRIKRSNEEAVSAWLKRGQASKPYLLSATTVKQSRIAIALDYVAIGFEHILPKGLDHILFVFGIFLLSIHLKPLLWQVTAFTVAHTITLGLCVYGLISVPASVVEPLIALSIAYIGIENCLSSRLHSWRIVIVFCFGLLHGMGFAGVLSEIGLPQSEFLTALITFNVGVELGQLTIILMAFIVLGRWRNKDWYRFRVVIPFSALISATGLYWTWERIFS